MSQQRSTLICRFFAVSTRLKLLSSHLYYLHGLYHTTQMNGSNPLSKTRTFREEKQLCLCRGQTCCTDTAMSLNYHFLDGVGLTTQGCTCGASSTILQHSVDALNVRGDERYKIEDSSCSKNPPSPQRDIEVSGSFTIRHSKDIV